jgi:microcystin-dependent protein
MWDEPISEIPSGWAICDGNNGTENMLGDFPEGEIDETKVGNTGGAATVTLSESQLPSHNHPNSNTGSTGDHSHTISYDENDFEPGSDINGGGAPGSRNSVNYAGSHSHNISSIGSTGGNASIDNNPSYYEIVFIQKL